MRHARRSPGFRLLASLGGALLLAAPASATPETLRASIADVICAPLDMLFSPITAMKSVHDGLRDIDDSLGVRLFYPLPAVLWNTGMMIGTGGIRAAYGLLTLPIGIGLFPFETDLDPLFAPLENSEGLIDFETDWLWFRAGQIYVPS